MLRTKNVVRAFLCQRDLNPHPPEENSCIRAWSSYPPHRGGGISQYKAYTFAAGITPFFTAAINVNWSSKDHARIMEFSSGGGGGSGHLVYHLSFSKVPEEVQHFLRGVQLLPGEGCRVQLLIPYRNHITCDFPVSPSGSAHEDTTIRGLNKFCPPPPPPPPPPGPGRTWVSNS